MKYLALILSIIIFHQSLSVCAPDVVKHLRKNTKVSCSVDNENSSFVGQKHSCCKSSKNDTNEDQKDDCCGDNCKCLSCLKVFTPDWSAKTIELQSISKAMIQRTILPVLCHSYDFHKAIKNPPKR